MAESVQYMHTAIVYDLAGVYLSFAFSIQAEIGTRVSSAVFARGRHCGYSVQDFWQMVVHHVTTISLFVMSWTANMVRVGTLVLCVHDAVDYFLEVSNICSRSDMQTLSFLSLSVVGLTPVSCVGSKLFFFLIVYYVFFIV